MATLFSLLGGRRLTAMVKGTKSNLPIRIPPAFLAPNRKIRKNTCTFKRVDGSRKVARIVQYGGPAARRTQEGVTDIPITLLHSFESQSFDVSALLGLMDLATEAETQYGKSEVARQTAEFKQLFANLRVAATTMGVCKGYIYGSSAGNLQTGSSGAAVTVDYGIPAANRNQIGGTIAAKWSAATTDIITQIRNLKQKAIQTTGYPLKYAFYGDSVPAWVANNTKAKALLEANAALAAKFLETGEVPDGFMGLTWVPLGDAFFVDQDGTTQTIIDDDQIAFWPEPTLDMWEFIEGSFAVPMGFGKIAAEAADILSGLQEVYGMFSYAAGEIDPPSVEQFAGDTFIPVLKVPSAAFIADVDF